MADYSITGIEIVQTVQTPDNKIPLIGYKTTFVRVYVESQAPIRVTARLNVPTRGGGLREFLPILSEPGLAITASLSGSHRNTLDDSFIFRLDNDLTAPGTRNIYARIYSVSASGDPDPAPPAFQERSTSATFGQRIDLRVFGVVWAAMNHDDDPFDYTGPAAPWSDFEEHRQFVENVYPVSSFSIDPLPSIGPTPPNPQSFKNLSESRLWADKKLTELPEGSIINLLDNWDSGGLHGLASGSRTEEQNQRTNERLGNVMAQEVAHALGLDWHTFTPGTPYPRSDGSLDPLDVGIDLTSGMPRIVDGTSRFDIMSYHTPPPSNWVSSFTYLQLMSAITARVPVSPPLPPPPLLGPVDHCAVLRRVIRADTRFLTHLYRRLPNATSHTEQDELNREIDELSGELDILYNEFQFRNCHGLP